VSDDLDRIEQIINASAVADIELLLPIGVRPRQLKITTLLIGMTLAMRAGRQAFLTDVHETLTALPDGVQRRLGVIARWPHGEHRLTYRQVEYTFDRLTTALAKTTPDGTPSEQLQAVLGRLLEASVQILGEPASSSYAVDWTDLETWSRPPPKPRSKHADPATPTDPDQPTPHTPNDTTNSTTDDSTSTTNDSTSTTSDSTSTSSDSNDGDGKDRPCADPEASWGHRNSNHPARNELFHGYYLQAITTVRDEHGPAVPELARRMHLASCKHDPPAEIVPVLERMHTSGIPIADMLADSGYAYRVPETWALPLRALGINLIQDLHPNDRGPDGTHMGATRCNGNLYCPATPTTLLELSPLPRAASAEQTNTHDRLCAELARYKLSPLTGYDPDGYRRVICPAAQGKLRCPLRPESMTLPHQHPTILTPPQHPPACCTQTTITVPPSVNAKTAQKHDYPSPEHRTSYNRRTASERTFATLTDRATNDLSRGWCRLFGLTPIALFTATALIARNIRVADAYAARQAENNRRAASGLPSKQRRRRRQTTTDLIATANTPP
jgi:hypothetical protein